MIVYTLLRSIICRFTLGTAYTCRCPSHNGFFGCVRTGVTGGKKKMINVLPFNAIERTQKVLIKHRTKNHSTRENRSYTISGRVYLLKSVLINGNEESEQGGRTTKPSIECIVVRGLLRAQCDGGSTHYLMFCWRKIIYGTVAEEGPTETEWMAHNNRIVVYW